MSYLKTKELRPVVENLLHIIYRLSNTEICTRTSKQLGSRIDRSPSSVQTYLREAEDLDLIERKLKKMDASFGKYCKERRIFFKSKLSVENLAVVLCNHILAYDEEEKISRDAICAAAHCTRQQAMEALQWAEGQGWITSLHVYGDQMTVARQAELVPVIDLAFYARNPFRPLSLQPVGHHLDDDAILAHVEQEVAAKGYCNSSDEDLGRAIKRHVRQAQRALARLLKSHRLFAAKPHQQRRRYLDMKPIDEAQLPGCAEDAAGRLRQDLRQGGLLTESFLALATYLGCGERNLRNVLKGMRPEGVGVSRPDRLVRLSSLTGPSADPDQILLSDGIHAGTWLEIDPSNAAATGQPHTLRLAPGWARAVVQCLAAEGGYTAINKMTLEGCARNAAQAAGSLAETAAAFDNYFHECLVAAMTPTASVQTNCDATGSQRSPEPITTPLVKQEAIPEATTPTKFDDDEREAKLAASVPLGEDTITMAALLREFPGASVAAQYPDGVPQSEEPAVADPQQPQLDDRAPPDADTPSTSTGPPSINADLAEQLLNVLRVGPLVVPVWRALAGALKCDMGELASVLRWALRTSLVVRSRYEGLHLLAIANDVGKAPKLCILRDGICDASGHRLTPGPPDSALAGHSRDMIGPWARAIAQMQTKTKNAWLRATSPLLREWSKDGHAIPEPVAGTFEQEIVSEDDRLVAILLLNMDWDPATVAPGVEFYARAEFAWRYASVMMKDMPYSPTAPDKLIVSREYYDVYGAPRFSARLQGRVRTTAESQSRLGEQIGRAIFDEMVQSGWFEPMTLTTGRTTPRRADRTPVL